MFNDWEKSILRVLCYFSVLDRPLTLLEIWRWTREKATLFSVREVILSLQKKGVIDLRNGFYFLSGQGDLVVERNRRYVYSMKKIKRARRFIGLMSRFPWVRGIAVYSSLACLNAQKGSDIDLFVISADSRAWSARFFLNLFLKIFNLRPNDATAEDKFCLSLLADENHLDLSIIMDEDDWHYRFGSAQFLFFFGEASPLSSDGFGEAREKFFTANSYLRDFFPNDFGQETDFHLAGHCRCQRICESIFGLIGEGIYRRVQLLILPFRYKRTAKTGDKSVVLGERLIKLHHNDKRRAVNEKFKERFEQILNGGQV